MQAYARLFLSEGYAVLLYDKRGCGESGGTYVTGGDAVTPANVQLLATDVVEAATSLTHRPEIDAHRLGIFGLSCPSKSNFAANTSLFPLAPSRDCAPTTGESAPLKYS